MKLKRCADFVSRMDVKVNARNVIWHIIAVKIVRIMIIRI
jgi:hypothetical protein